MVVVVLDCDLRIVAGDKEVPACCKSESNPLPMDVIEDVCLCDGLSSGIVVGKGPACCCNSESNPLPVYIDGDVVRDG